MKIYMIKIKRMLTALFLCSMVIIGAAQDRLVTYPAPIGASLANDFTVRVRQAGGDWKNVDTYTVKVDEVRDAKHNVCIASLCYFDFSGEVEIEVISNMCSVNIGKIRPLSFGIKPLIAGNTMTFKLTSPRNLSIEVNDDIFHNLHLFANPIDGNKPKRLKDKNLIYFAPGIHQLPGDTLDIPSGKTVYVAGGAIVRGCIRAKDCSNVKILGRGIVHPEGRGAGIETIRSKKVFIDGLITTQCPTGGSDSVTIHNVKTISSYGWGDGMNVFASSNVMLNGVFCRNSDDCTTVYATRMGFVGGSKNITMQNSTLWADVAHPIFIGIHGNAEKVDTIQNVKYMNIDILDHKEKQLDYQGCMAINGGDNNVIKNITFENIRIENFREGQLVNLRIFYNEKYCTAPGKSIENILFKDIEYNGDRANISMIIGYDKERMVRNIRFENLKINGEYIYDDMPGKPKWYKTGDMCRIFVGEHTEDITFTFRPPASR